eukprot:Amastigsp_a174749_9.p2 type:complete len:180 gc:universal Amastigsp_a174749_9:597-1136(+)
MAGCRVASTRSARARVAVALASRLGVHGSCPTRGSAVAEWVASLFARPRAQRPVGRGARAAVFAARDARPRVSVSGRQRARRRWRNRARERASDCCTARDSLVAGRCALGCGRNSARRSDSFRSAHGTRSQCQRPCQRCRCARSARELAKVAGVGRSSGRHGDLCANAGRPCGTAGGEQ